MSDIDRIIQQYGQRSGYHDMHAMIAEVNILRAHVRALEGPSNVTRMQIDEATKPLDAEIEKLRAQLSCKGTYECPICKIGEPHPHATQLVRFYNHMHIKEKLITDLRAVLWEYITEYWFLREMTDKRLALEAKARTLLEKK
jgi:hypothetical protein